MGTRKVPAVGAIQIEKAPVKGLSRIRGLLFLVKDESFRATYMAVFQVDVVIAGFFRASDAITVVSRGRDFGLPPFLRIVRESVSRNAVDINDIPRK